MVNVWKPTEHSRGTTGKPGRLNKHGWTDWWIEEGVWLLHHHNTDKFTLSIRGDVDSSIGTGSIYTPKNWYVT